MSHNSELPSALRQAQERLRAWLARAQRRSWLGVLAYALPLLLVAGAALAWSQHVPLAWVLTAMGSASLLLVVWAVALAHRRWTLPCLLRQLDRALPKLEDSSALLLLPTPASTSTLIALQQARVVQRLPSAAPLALRAPWPLTRLSWVWLLSAVTIYALLRWPLAMTGELPPSVSMPLQQAVPAGATRLLEVQLRIEAPAYTGLPVREQKQLEARALEGALLHWQLRFDPVPSSAALEFVDGQRLPLTLSDGVWSARLKLQQANLYRLAVDASAPPLSERALHTLNMIADTPPQLRVLSPQLSLTRHDPTSSQWSLELEASDDYGLGAAELLLTRTQGSGEQVTVSEQRIALRGRGDARQRRYSHQVDLQALGLAEGDDLIARFEVTDQRQPQAQSTRSASYILRWPPPPVGEASGVEGFVNTTLPAYFRSQRQIIIDTETLLAESPRRAEQEFAIRADEIGVDQRLLRLRYGQFLGEEFEPPPTPPGLPEDAAGADAKDEHDHHEGDGHDHGEHGADGPAAAFGDAGAVQAEYGHVHDIAEAATLLDPATRKLLKAALDEMWQAELYLRSAQPRAALPYEYRALEFIKQVQQGSRIYLARVGLELPPIDFERRFTGDREGLRPRADPLAPADRAVDLFGAAWRVLDAWELADQSRLSAQQGMQEGLAELSRGLLSSELQTEQRLALLAGIDALQQDPQCTECVAALRKALWPLLAAPPAAVFAKPRPDASGQAYLDALDVLEAAR